MFVIIYFFVIWLGFRAPSLGMDFSPRFVSYIVFLPGFPVVMSLVVMKFVFFFARFSCFHVPGCHDDRQCLCLGYQNSGKNSTFFASPFDILRATVKSWMWPHWGWPLMVIN